MRNYLAKFIRTAARWAKNILVDQRFKK